jgi:hypothetical protein
LLLLEYSSADWPTANAGCALDVGLGSELTAIAEQIPHLLTSWLERVAEQR